ncbi:hypothetical protein [Roseobacter sp.]|uniref:hypothetical protein n=1 Tax=Roseobacter sp. TaxID=1907202 RepID=UPI00385D91F8
MTGIKMLPLLATVMACAPVALPPSSLPFFGNGYRYEGDPCRRLGEDATTNLFLDDAADLVGCPSDAEILGAFTSDTGAVAVAQREGFTLYSVPTR